MCELAARSLAALTTLFSGTRKARRHPRLRYQSARETALSRSSPWSMQDGIRASRDSARTRLGIFAEAGSAARKGTADPRLGATGDLKGHISSTCIRVAR